jgi:hypothetical protein
VIEFDMSSISGEDRKDEEANLDFGQIDVLEFLVNSIETE